ncbi:putative membrane protein [Chryseobacterium sp. SORGH_AS 447]|uniref:DUF2339 domain-containing protein n=1 Tax=Chryseobacterium sp. SORGH_AS_0447 TaxID=3041769 RepID=UPI00277DFF78|nr:DUF2339 domain-containing protein [Chryseobacterium sp. SORGH_AS_0447]MDQ1162696.1 putative membrane protein [Chryseobacterium sp. SORGH_AS_0447]
MAYAIITITILVICIFNNYNERIRKLEREIAELNRKINEEGLSRYSGVAEETADPAIITETQKIPVLSVSSTTENKVPQEKDWLAPVFEFLKQNALTIIGIFTLVLGIGYFVKYAIDKNWIGETSRVGIGFLAGALIMGTGHFLRKNYAAFASIITGGGIAVLYFTITIAFREYHLFSQTTAFSVTCFITLLCIVLSYSYNSEILNIFSLFGGFLAPLMISSGESNYFFLFTYLTVLNIGMLAVVYLKNWKSVGWISFIFTAVYLASWTADQTQIQSVYFYIVTYIIFYLFALQNYFKKNTLLPYDILMLVLINFTGITGLVYIFETLRYEPVIIFPVIFALVNLGLLYREYSKQNFGINYSVFAGITVSLFTAAVALQFKTHLITSVWAIEATLLLFIWKKTNLSIFKICFYILFPLVIIAQLVTWAEYLDAKNLPIIFNPIFLTSAVTVITTFVNLVLLRKLSDFKDENSSLFENAFTIISYSVIYVALLLEIVYQISEKPWIVIFSTAMLYSLYFVFIILLFRKKLEINTILEAVLLYVFFALIIFNTLISGTGIVSDHLLQLVPFAFYVMYLLYWIPFIVVLLTILPRSGFLKIKLSYWWVSLAIVTAISGELYNMYILFNAGNISDLSPLTKHFSLLYLPIIWAVLASAFLYKGLKSDVAEYSKIGFALIAVMIFKLYSYDVWKMDNVSRITAFIILGIILLLSSFLFQRIKRMIRNMVEKKDENTDSEEITN